MSMLYRSFVHTISFPRIYKSIGKPFGNYMKKTEENATVKTHYLDKYENREKVYRR